ncbi:MAG TPA: cobalamin-binding protein [Longimicrobium sp.]|nr:cobalamin-binding protein [Longimicrobium sp.]
MRPRRAPAGLLALALLLAACGGAKPSDDARAAADSAVAATDDAGREIRLARPAARIVSLVPSATETLVALGARETVVGRTDYDEAPEVAAVPSVGGGLDPSLEKLAALRPDLVIGWETVGRPELRDRLEALGIPVFAMATQDTADVFRGIASLGRLTGRGRAADSLAAAVRAELDAVRASVAGKPRPSVFWLVQTDPPMTAGRATFVSELVEVAGGRNAFGDLEALWPNVSMEEIVRRQPDVLIVPVVEARTARVEELRALPGWRELRAMREGRARSVDAELVNRPGPSIGKAARAVAEAIHASAAPR